MLHLLSTWYSRLSVARIESGHSAQRPIYSGRNPSSDMCPEGELNSAGTFMTSFRRTMAKPDKQPTYPRLMAFLPNSWQYTMQPASRCYCTSESCHVRRLEAYAGNIKCMKGDKDSPAIISLPVKEYGLSICCKRGPAPVLSHCTPVRAIFGSHDYHVRLPSLATARGNS